MKKLIAAALAVLMLALPVMSMAAGPVEMLMEPFKAGRAIYQESAVSMDMESYINSLRETGVDEESITSVSGTMNAIGELLASLTARQYIQSNQAGFSLDLNETEAAYLKLGTAEEGRFWLKSNFLGEEAVSLNKEELVSLLKTLGVEVPEELESMLSGEAVELKMPSFENTMAALQNLFISVAGGMQMQPVEEQPGDCDPVAYSTSIVLTAEDLKPLGEALKADLEEMPEVFWQFTGGKDAFYSGIDQFSGMLDPLVVTLYFDESGADVPCVNVSATLHIPEEEPFDVLYSMCYMKKTTEEGIAILAETKSLDTKTDEATHSVTNGLVSEAGYSMTTCVYEGTGENVENEQLKMQLVFQMEQAVAEDGSTVVNMAGEISTPNEEGELQAVTTFEGVLTMSEDGSSFSFQGTVANPASDPASAVAFSISSNEQAFDMTLSSTSGEDVVVISVHGEQAEGEDGSSKYLAFSISMNEQQMLFGEMAINGTSDGVDAEVVCEGYVEISGLPRISFTQRAYTGEPQPDEDLTNSVRPGTMSQEDLMNWLQGVGTTATTQLIQLMQQLPESVLTVLMQSGVLGTVQ